MLVTVFSKCPCSLFTCTGRAFWLRICFSHWLFPFCLPLPATRRHGSRRDAILHSSIVAAWSFTCCSNSAMRVVAGSALIIIGAQFKLPLTFNAFTIASTRCCSKSLVITSSPVIKSSRTLRKERFPECLLHKKRLTEPLCRYMRCVRYP